MRWDDFRRSDNVEDDRDGGGGGFGGGGFGIPVGGGGLGIGTIVVLGLIGWALGIDPSILIGGAEIHQRRRLALRSSPTRQRRAHRRADRPDRAVRRRRARQHRGRLDGDFPAPAASNIAPPRLRLYRGGEQGGCGFAQAAMGPFYCPNDQRIYLDTSFFRDMQHALPRLQRQGLRVRRGLRDRARGRPSRAEPARHSAEGAAGAAAPPAARRRPTASRCASNCRPIASPASGRTTPTSAGNSLEPGDVEAALQTASAIGDDRLQKQSRGYVVPDAFTHGSSAQRQRWF